MNNGETPSAPSVLAYAALGTVLGAVAALLASSSAVAPPRDATSPGPLESTLVFSFAGALAGTVHFLLRRLKEHGDGLRYLRWTASLTAAALIIGGLDSVQERSFEPLLLALSLGVTAGFAAGMIEKYVRSWMR